MVSTSPLIRFRALTKKNGYVVAASFKWDFYFTKCKVVLAHRGSKCKNRFTLRVKRMLFLRIKTKIIAHKKAPAILSAGASNNKIGYFIDSTINEVANIDSTIFCASALSTFARLSFVANSSNNGCNVVGV